MTRRKWWNPLDMPDLHASNLTLLFGLGCIGTLVIGNLVIGDVKGDPALLGVLGTACITQRFLFSTRKGGRNARREKGGDVADGTPTQPPADRDDGAVAHRRSDPDQRVRRLPPRRVGRPALG